MLLRNIAALGGVFLGLLSLAPAAEREAGPPVERHVNEVALPIDTETLDRQYLALSSMPSVEVVYSALGPVRTIRGATGVELSRSTRDLRAGQDAPEVLQKFKDVLLATGSETLKVRLNELSAIGRAIRMDQVIGGIPVLYGAVSVGVDDATGLVNVLGATFLPDRGLPRQPKISEAEAAKLAEQYLVKFGIAKPGSVKTSTPTLAYTGTHPDSTRGHLVWAVPASYTPEGAGATSDIFWFDAIDGAFVGQDAVVRGKAPPRARSFDRKDRQSGLANLVSGPDESSQVPHLAFTMARRCAVSRQLDHRQANRAAVCGRDVQDSYRAHTPSHSGCPRRSTAGGARVQPSPAASLAASPLWRGVHRNKPASLATLDLLAFVEP